MRVFKLSIILFYIYLGLVLTVFMLGVRRLSPDHPKFKGIVQWWYEKLCQIMKIKVTVHGRPMEGITLYAVNHISWLDIPVLGSVANPSFLSKAEVRKWPLIGWLAEKVGTLFIERGCKEAASSAKQAMLDRLTGQDGKPPRSVLFFPEGTTSDGRQILRFKARLFDVAIEEGIPVQPILLIFPDPEHGVNQSIPFTGNQNLLTNVMDVLKRNDHHAEVHFLEPIMDTQNYTPKELAKKSEVMVQEAFDRVTSGAITPK